MKRSSVCAALWDNFRIINYVDRNSKHIYSLSFSTRKKPLNFRWIQTSMLETARGLTNNDFNIPSS